MKNFKLKNAVILLFAVLTLSNCDDNNPIQIEVVDEFTRDLTITGLANSQTLAIAETIDVSDIIDKGTTFVAADIESITITLQNDYSGTSIAGSFKITIAGLDVVDQSMTLTKGTGEDFAVPANAANILDAIKQNSSALSVNVTGSTNNVIGDDDFTIRVEVKIKAILNL